MPFTTQDNLLTLDAGLAHFKAVYMPARNYSKRTREEYESDLSDLISFLTLRNLTVWQVVGLRDLQSYLADLTAVAWLELIVTARPVLDRRWLCGRHPFGHLRRDMLPPTPYCRRFPYGG